MSNETCYERSSDTSDLHWNERDLAAYYGVSIRTIQRWTRSGQLPSPFCMGRKKLWMRDQVVMWMHERGAKAEAEAEKERLRLANYSWKGR